jgi:hypothetical protein
MYETRKRRFRFPNIAAILEPRNGAEVLKQRCASEPRRGEGLAHLAPAEGGAFPSGGGMSETMQKVVDAYVRLNRRQALVVLKARREKLVFDMKASGELFNLSSLVGQINEDIAIIDAGLHQLDGSADRHSPATDS